MLEGFNHQAKEIPTWTWFLSPMASLLESSSWDGTNGLLINMKDSTIWEMEKWLSWRKALVEGSKIAFPNDYIYMLCLPVFDFDDCRLSWRWWLTVVIWNGFVAGTLCCYTIQRKSWDNLDLRMRCWLIKNGKLFLFFLCVCFLLSY